MAVPSPSIRPVIVPGGTQIARYVGPVGVRSGSASGARTRASVLVTNTGANSPPTPPIANVGEQLLAPDGTVFTVTGLGDSQGPYTESRVVYVESVNVGPVPSVTTGTVLTFQAEQNWLQASAPVIDIVQGRTAEPGKLHIDLTVFQPSERKAKHFVDRLRIDFKALDGGIRYVGPHDLTRSHFGGDKVIEYVTLDIDSSDEANEALVLIHAPHTTGW